MNYFFILFLLPVFVSATSNIEIVYLIDSSSSIGQNKFKNAKKLISDVSEQILTFDVNASYSLINYGHKVKTYATKDDSIFFKKLNHASSFDSSSTKMSLAFNAVNRKIFTKPSEARRIIVSITDGVPKPAKRYGGEKIVNELNDLIQYKNLTKLIYFEVNQTNSLTPANSNQYVKIGSFYNKTSDHLQASFLKPFSQIQVQELVKKIVGLEIYNAQNASVTSTPTSAPSSTLASVSPSLSPSASPSALPSASPSSSSPTVLQTRSPTITPESSSSSHSLAPLIILGLFIGGSVIAFLYFCCNRKKSEKESEIESEIPVQTEENSDDDYETVDE